MTTALLLLSALAATAPVPTPAPAPRPAARPADRPHDRPENKGDPALTQELWQAEGDTLRQLVATARGEDRGEALLRLGEWERAAADRIARELADGDAGGRGRVAELADRSDRHLSSAVREAAPARVPRALYALGDLRRTHGRNAKAVAPLAELVRRFPEHPLAADAAVDLGDDAFEEGRLAEAVRRYEFAAAAGGRVEAWARYKLAWCHLNLEDYAQARAEFAKVVALSQDGRASFQLADEARRDLVLALARDPAVGAEKAAESLRRLAPAERSPRLVEGYARIIADSGRDAEATELLRGLLPGAEPERAVGLLSALVEIATRRRDGAGAVEAASRLADIVEARPQTDAESLQGAERVVRTAAVTLHSEGRAAGRTPMLESALALYEAWFRAFSGAPAAYELHHHAGELLQSLKRPADAERHYTAAVETDLARLAKGEPAGRWMAASARGAVECARDAIGPGGTQAVAAVSDTDEPLAAPPPAPTVPQGADERLLHACERFLRLLPADPGAQAVAYSRAWVLYRHNQLEQATAAFRDVALGGGAEVQVPAARLSLDAMRLLGRYDDLAKLAAEYQGHAALASLREELQRVREGALLAAAAREAAQGRPDEAARRYLDFATRFPSSPRLDRALYNGAAALAAAGKHTDGLEVRARLVESLPGSPLAPRAKERQLAELVSLARFAEARAFAGPGKEGWTPTRLHDAIVLGDAAGDRRGADALRELYLRRFPKGPDAMAHALALVDEAPGCAARRRYALRAVDLAPDPGWHAVALVRLAKAELACGRRDEARAQARAAVRLEPAVPVGRADGKDACAEAALLLTDATLERYRALKLGEPWQRTLPRKIAALEQAEKELGAVVARGRAAPGVCALVRSGEAWAELAGALGSAKAPRGLTPEQQELFREDLSSKAQPLLDRAKTALATAVARARAAAVAPACLDDAQRTLASLDPARWGPTPEAILPLLEAPVAPPLAAPAVLALAPDAPSAWLLAARAELSAGRPEAALVLAARLKPADPLAPEAAEVRAQALSALGRREAALAAWALLAREQPRRPAPRRALADEALRRRDFEGAREQLLALTELAPHDPAVAVDLAVALRGLGDAKGAEQALREARKLDPGRNEPLLNLGLLLCGDGARPVDGLKALEEFERRGGRAPDRRGYETALATCRALAGGNANAQR